MATTHVPEGKHARNLANRFHKHGEAYFQFITRPGVEPTNNLAEQAIRFVVIDRRSTQGTRSETGRRWCERIWTTIATCAQQGRSDSSFCWNRLNLIFTALRRPRSCRQAPDAWAGEKISRFRGVMVSVFVPGRGPGGFFHGRFERWGQDAIHTSSRPCE
ncbi:MAG: transposase [Propionibacteriaceae bacterium]|nr:transposase [Propionibacteriaceae bacterium]